MNFGQFLKDWRRQKGLTMLELSQMITIDQALLSKYESGNRLPSDKHLLSFSVGMDISLHNLRKEVLADKIANLLYREEAALEILKVAETRVAYLSSSKALQLQALNDDVKEKLTIIDGLQKEWKAIVQKSIN